MGYTHYWTMKDTVTEDDLKDGLEFLKLLSERMDIPLGDGTGEKEQDYKLVNGELCFNGYKKDSYETFCFAPGTSEFCKTAHRPYDVICVAMLIWAWKRGLLESFSSDGFLLDWIPGIEAYAYCSSDFTDSDYERLRLVLDKYFDEDEIMPKKVSYKISKDLKPEDLAELLKMTKDLSEEYGIGLGDAKGNGSSACISMITPDLTDETKVMCLEFNGKKSPLDWRGDPIRIYAGATKTVETKGYPYAMILDACLSWLWAYGLLEEPRKNTLTFASQWIEHYLDWM